VVGAEWGPGGLVAGVRGDDAGGRTTWRATGPADDHAAASTRVSAGAAAVIANDAKSAGRKRLKARN
jgi:hypothetical protein